MEKKIKGVPMDIQPETHKLLKRIALDFDKNLAEVLAIAIEEENKRCQETETDIIPKKKKKRINIPQTKEEYARTKEIAKQQGLTIQAHIENAIISFAHSKGIQK